MNASVDPAVALATHGYLRYAAQSDFGEAPRKEWLHFVVQSPELDLLVNFSTDDGRGAGPGGRRHALACVARPVGGGWRGDVEEVPDAEVRRSPGRLSLRFGASFLRPSAGGLRLRADGRGDVEADLELAARTYPMFAPNVVVDGRPAMHWFVVPRMTATGRVRIGREEYDVRGARAYHDHNWGEFRWGGDFAWNWGFVTPCAEAESWSLVLLRLTDRGRSRDAMRSMVLWDGEQQARVFRNAELEIEADGLLRARGLVKLPRSLALLSPGEVTDVPRRLVARARRGDDALDLEFIPEDVMRFVVPDDVGLGSTSIHEVVGTARVQGRVGRKPVAFETRSVFEFVGS
jgi:hypothetical protein